MIRRDFMLSMSVCPYRSPRRLIGEVPVLRASIFPRTVAPVDPDCLAVHKGVGDLFPRLVEVAPEGLSGDAEDSGGLLLLKPLEVDEPQRLYLFGEDDDKLAAAAAERAETPERPLVSDPPGGTGPAALAAPAATPTGFSLVHATDPGIEIGLSCR